MGMTCETCNGRGYIWGTPFECEDCEGYGETHYDGDDDFYDFEGEEDAV